MHLLGLLEKLMNNYKHVGPLIFEGDLFSL